MFFSFSTIFSLMLMFVVLSGCEKPEDTAKRIKESPRYPLHNLEINRSKRAYEIFIQDASWESKFTETIINYDSTGIGDTPMVKQYIIGDNLKTELIFKNEEKFHEYMKSRIKRAKYLR